MIFSKKFVNTTNVRLVLPTKALEVIFGECDRYDADETGGRILGTYADHNGELVIKVTGIIEPGPAAKRTSTYFLQDGEYQERVFRKVEDREPSIEHLGNWHTHHVNGLRHLSDGDIETYRRIVEHKNHNTDFFYALLVIEKKSRKAGHERYIFKNYFFLRDDPTIYEIPSSAIEFVDVPLVWPNNELDAKKNVEPQDSLQQSRVYDKDLVNQFFPHVKTFMSKELGVYWRGPINLIDGSKVEAVVIEHLTDGRAEYALALRKAPALLSKTVDSLGLKAFASCRAALISAERECNAALFKKNRGDA